MTKPLDYSSSGFCHCFSSLAGFLFDCEASSGRIVTCDIGLYKWNGAQVELVAVVAQITVDNKLLTSRLKQAEKPHVKTLKKKRPAAVFRVFSGSWSHMLHVCHHFKSVCFIFSPQRDSSTRCLNSFYCFYLPQVDMCWHVFWHTNRVLQFSSHVLEFIHLMSHLCNDPESIRQTLQRL